jgi:hypothetical protein
MSKPDPYAIYKESLTRLQQGKGDARDDVLVQLWKSSLNVRERAVELERKNKMLERQKGEIAYANQLLESKVAFLTDGKITLDFEEMTIPTHH